MPREQLNSDPWADPKSRSTLGLYKLHNARGVSESRSGGAVLNHILYYTYDGTRIQNWSIGVKIWGFHFSEGSGTPLQTTWQLLWLHSLLTAPLSLHHKSPDATLLLMI